MVGMTLQKYLESLMGGDFKLFAGGLFYIICILFYAIHRIPYNHVIWHVLVLAGAMSHFFMILFYVV
jgi:hemolysin III